MGVSSLTTGPGASAGLSPTTSAADICAVRSWRFVATMRMEALVACSGTPSIAPLPPPRSLKRQTFRQSARSQPQSLAAGVDEGRQLRSISGPDCRGRQVDTRLRGLRRQRVGQRFGCHRAWRLSGGFRRRRGLKARGLGLPGRIRLRGGRRCRVRRPPVIPRKQRAEAIVATSEAVISSSRSSPPARWTCRRRRRERSCPSAEIVTEHISGPAKAQDRDQSSDQSRSPAAAFAGDGGGFERPGRFRCRRLPGSDLGHARRTVLRQGLQHRLKERPEVGSTQASSAGTTRRLSTNSACDPAMSIGRPSSASARTRPKL